MPDLREKVARIVDPEAFDEGYGTTVYALLAKRRETALTKADAILEASEVGWRVDEFLAEVLCKDQHGPSFWGKLTPLGREMYVERFRRATSRANQARAQALPTPPEVK